MPRNKLKNAMGSSRDKVTKIPPKPSVKEDPEKGQIEGTDDKMPDFSVFKFDKKPRIKIEYEKDSPEKDKVEPKGLWEPANWKEFLINLRNMRSNNDAPVDSMGCHKTMDENAPPKVMRYQSLIALMLSSQTKDQVTFAAMERLREKGLTVDNVLNLSDDELGKLIYPVGFWKTKVKYIKKTTQTLKEQYDSDIPDSVEKLCKLTGVGPKMAHICMQVAWNKTTGIGVDTHVHRISNRIGWVKKPTSTPEDTRKALQSWLPFELWSEVNHLMVGFGQTICQPVSPMCHECLNRDICPSSGIGRKSPKKKSPMKKNIKDEIKMEVQNLHEKITVASPERRNTTTEKVVDLVDKPIKQEIQNSFNLEDITATVPQKRRVISKNNSKAVIIADKETLTAEMVYSADSIRVPQIKCDMLSDETGGLVNEYKISMVQDKIAIKKSSNKNTIQTKNENVDTKDTTNNAIVMKSPNKRKASTKAGNQRETTQVKRKSPRTKNNFYGVTGESDK